MPQTTRSNDNRSGDEYPSWIGLIFVFNLIVGTGALTLPSVFARAGWLLGLILIIILAGISYITVTFIIETMACANAIIKWKRLFTRNQKRLTATTTTKRERRQRQRQLLDDNRRQRNRMTLKNASLNVAAAAAAAAASAEATATDESVSGVVPPNPLNINSNNDQQLRSEQQNPLYSNGKSIEVRRTAADDDDDDADADEDENENENLEEDFMGNTEYNQDDYDQEDDDDDDEFNGDIEQTPLFPSAGAVPYVTDDDDDDYYDDGGESAMVGGGGDHHHHHHHHHHHRRRYYILDNKIELGEMADLFLSDFGRILFYLCIAVYLYGDLSIYAAAVAKTLRNIICVQNETSSSLNNATNNNDDDDNDNDDLLRMEPCWPGHTMTRFDCYRLALIGFITIMGPFTFFNIQKTKYIQIFTVTLRWLAFSIMIIIAIRRLVIYGRVNNPPMADFDGIPALFGACVYSFMCHHSLPSLLAPIRGDKRDLHTLISFDYILICCFYLCLALTGTFAFTHLDDLYTLNFIPSANDWWPSSDDTPTITLFDWIISYFLILFPVFTLSTSFPIIAITLRNNLQTLFLNKTTSSSSSSSSAAEGAAAADRLTEFNNAPPPPPPFTFLYRRLLFPLLAILPPFAVTYFTDSLSSLVSFTGSYAGTGIQYLIPIVLVFVARNRCNEILGNGIINEYRSPFQHNGWLLFVFIWSVACLILVTLNFFH